MGESIQHNASLYTAQENTERRDTSMYTLGFEPMILVLQPPKKVGDSDPTTTDLT